MGNLKKKIAKELQTINEMEEAKILVKPENFDAVHDKLKDDDVVKFVDEETTDEDFGSRRGLNPNMEFGKIKSAIVSSGNPEFLEMIVKLANARLEQLSGGVAEGDEDYERASREVEYGVNPETGDDWEAMLSQVKEGNNGDKLRADVQKFMNRLNLGQFEQLLAKIDKPAEQAEIIAAFAERIGVPRVKLPMVLQSLKAVAAESVNPRMKKADLVEHVLKTKKK